MSESARFILLLIAALVTSSCRHASVPECDGDLIRLLEREILFGTKERVLMSDVARFSWSRVRLFDEYTSVEDLKRFGGLTYSESWWQRDHSPEGIALVVFSDQNAPVCYAEVPNEASGNGRWAISPGPFLESGYGRNAIALRIDREEGRPVFRVESTAE